MLVISKFQEELALKWQDVLILKKSFRGSNFVQKTAKNVFLLFERGNIQSHFLQMFCPSSFSEEKFCRFKNVSPLQRQRLYFFRVDMMSFLPLYSPGSFSEFHNFKNVSLVVVGSLFNWYLARTVSSGVVKRFVNTKKSEFIARSIQK